MPPPAASRLVRRKLRVNAVEQDDVDTTWERISDDPLITGLDGDQQRSAKDYLRSWIQSLATSSEPWVHSQDRQYDSDNHLIRALVGEVTSEANLEREGTLAEATYSSGQITTELGNFMTRLQTWHDQQGEEFRNLADQTKGRYNYYYSSFLSTFWSGGRSLGAAIASPPGDLNGRITLIADYALRLRRQIGALVEGGWQAAMPANLDQARKSHWNPDEGALWTQQARQQQVPLSAGPSATTMQIMALALALGAPDDEKEALAWAIFAFFNKGLWLNKSGTHRFHEVMAVAASYGVEYTAWAYPEGVP